MKTQIRFHLPLLIGLAVVAAALSGCLDFPPEFQRPPRDADRDSGMGDSAVDASAGRDSGDIGSADVSERLDGGQDLASQECVPDTPRSCRCPGADSSVGQQFCSTDGHGWEECTCGL